MIETPHRWAASQAPRDRGAARRRKILLAWSSGKDSAWTLHVLKQDPRLEIVGLVTTVNAEFDRIAMHAVRRSLLERQAKAAGIEPWIAEIPHPCTNERYEAAMAQVIERARRIGVSGMAFGDLFLEDIRRYREKQLAGSGVEPLFPLWMRDTSRLADEMQSAGMKARVTCVDPRVLDRTYGGRLWDRAFLDDLPDGVDPCGENGEFHTFVFDGPMFSHPIPVRLGELSERDDFVFADLLPD